jgi:hypothetical protein
MTLQRCAGNAAVPRHRHHEVLMSLLQTPTRQQQTHGE